MATSLLFVATDQPNNHEEQQTMNPLSGSSEETRNEPGRIRGRKGNVKGPKKQPQRGLGVAQLERLRMQECWKKMNESSSSSSSGVPTTTFPDHHHHQHQRNFLQCHPQMLPFTVHDPFGNTSGSSSLGGAPVRYGAAPAPNHVHGGGFQFQCPPQQVIHGNAVGFITGQGPFMGNKSGGLSVGCGGGVGWVVPNQINMVSSCGSGTPLWSPLVGTPLETSRELSSIPNVHCELECFDVCLKKTRFNEDNVKGSNARKDNPLDIWPNGPDFLGYTGAPNLDGEASDFHNKLARHDAAAADATHNHDEGVEVVAVHRKGNSMSGRVFMEYEFFPGKNGRGTASKELELPTIGSVVAVGAEASSITAATAYGNTACNSNNIDLSLKLSR